MKKMTLVAAAVLAVSSFGLLSGFDSAATAEDILSKSMEASREVTDTSAAATVKFDVDMAIPDMETSFKISADGNMDIAAAMDPFAVSNNAAFTVDVLGQQLGISLDLYMVSNEDGSVVMYMNMVQNGESTGWQVEDTGEAIDFKELMEKAKDFNFDFSKLPVEFVVADAPALCNGKECYELKATATVTDLIEIAKLALGKASELVGEAGEEAGVEVEDLEGQIDQYAELAAMFDGLLFNLTIDVDAESYYPAYIRFDMDGSDWAAVAPIIASLMDMTDEEGNVMQLNLGVNELFMDIAYDYDTPVAIEVPQEALDAAAGQAADAEPEAAA